MPDCRMALQQCRKIHKFRPGDSVIHTPLADTGTNDIPETNSRFLEQGDPRAVGKIKGYAGKIMHNTPELVLAVPIVLALSKSLNAREAPEN